MENPSRDPSLVNLIIYRLLPVPVTVAYYDERLSLTLSLAYHPPWKFCQCQLQTSLILISSKKADL